MKRSGDRQRSLSVKAYFGLSASLVLQAPLMLRYTNGLRSPVESCTDVADRQGSQPSVRVQSAWVPILLNLLLASAKRCENPNKVAPKVGCEALPLGVRIYILPNGHASSIHSLAASLLRMCSSHRHTSPGCCPCNDHPEPGDLHISRGVPEFAHVSTWQELPNGRVPCDLKHRC